jgi:hypothetical protein
MSASPRRPKPDPLLSPAAPAPTTAYHEKIQAAKEEAKNEAKKQEGKQQVDVMEVDDAPAFKKRKRRTLDEAEARKRPKQAIPGVKLYFSDDEGELDA